MTAHVADATGAERDVQVKLNIRQRLAIVAPGLKAAAVGRSYSSKIAVRGGVAGFRWSIAGGTLPAGLKLEAKIGTIAGVPRTSGTFRISVRVRDSLGAVSTKTLVLSVH